MSAGLAAWFAAAGGVLAPLSDPGYFAGVTVEEAGTIVWPGGIDLAPEPLYEQAKAHPLIAA